MTAIIWGMYSGNSIPAGDRVAPACLTNDPTLCFQRPRFNDVPFGSYLVSSRLCIKRRAYRSRWIKIRGRKNCVGMDLQQPLAPSIAEPLANLTAVLPLYQRVRVAAEQDVDRLYGLVTSYVAEPELASSVTEIVIDLDPFTSGWGCFLDPNARKHDPAEWQAREPAEPVRNDRHMAAEGYVNSMGLNDATTAEMAAALTTERRRQLDLDNDIISVAADKRAAFAVTAAILLLSLCKNLVTLYIGAVDSWLAQFLLMANYGELAGLPLQHLRHIQVIGDGNFGDERGYMHLEFFRYMQFFHRLPAVESFSADGVQEYQPELDLSVPRTSNLKALHITHCDVPSSSLDDLMRIPRRLRELSVTEGGLWSTDGGSPYMVMRTIGDALWQHQETLEVLDLDVDPSAMQEDSREDKWDGYSDEEVHEIERGRLELYGVRYKALDDAAQTSPPDYSQAGYEPHAGTIGSLTGFEALKNLTISLGILVGGSNLYTRPQDRAKVDANILSLVDMLPPQLESLRLYDYKPGENAAMDAQVDKLLSVKEYRFPRLKHVEGVQEMFPSLQTVYGYDPAEDQLYIRPELDLDWKEV